MPTIKQHGEISRKRTGKDYKELHEWMDANPRKKEERHDIGKIYEYGKMMEGKYRAGRASRISSAHSRRFSCQIQ